MFGKNTGKYFTNNLNGFRGKISQKKNISPQLFLSNFFETNIFSQNGIHYTFFATLFSDCRCIFKIVYFITDYADLTLFYTYTCDLLKNHINELHKFKCKQETIISRILFFKNFLATYDYSCHILAINKFIENTYLCRVGRRVGRNLQKLAGVSHFLLRSSYA